MKLKIAIFSTLLCMYGISGANASDCIGSGCAIEPMATTPISYGMPTPLPVGYNFGIGDYSSQESQPISTAAVKTISVKPVEFDNRAPLWDGQTAKHKVKKFDKTVDWRDGVPIWDDSISSYRDKDFSDWYLEPADEVYIGEAIETIRAQVENLLIPLKPSTDIWTTSTKQISEKYTAQDMTCITQDMFATAGSDGCPFETDIECDIWRRKPMIREVVSPRSPKLRADKIDIFIAQARANSNITANIPAAAPLVERYKLLMQSAQACCTDGMTYELKRAGATDGLIYKFLSDDANFYNIGNRCLMTSDSEFDKKYPNAATAAVAADVRNGCLCRGQQWFSAMLAPFETAYQAAPEFAKSRFTYTYTDGLRRDITVSINNDVQNVLNQLKLCP